MKTSVDFVHAHCTRFVVLYLTGVSHHAPSSVGTHLSSLSPQSHLCYAIVEKIVNQVQVEFSIIIMLEYNFEREGDEGGIHLGGSIYIQSIIMHVLP